MSFQFPKIYNFPPFFTKQPNEQTWTAQRQQWTELVLAYCRFYRVWIINERGVALSQGNIDTDEPEKKEAEESELFHNKQIDRKLDLDTIQILFKEMMSQGDVSLVNKKDSSRFFVHWNRPEDWAAMVLEWVESTGQSGSVLTLYEIANGELSLRQEFHGIHPQVLELALAVLVKRGRAQLIKDEDGRVAGVKVQ